MKTKIQARIKIYFTAILIASSLLLNSAVAQGVYEENNSIVVVEVESAPIITGWSSGNTTVEGKEITYYFNHVQDYFSTPGNHTLEYKVKINNTGTYRFQWHCKVGEGTSATEANDSWLKIPDADDFYAEKMPGSTIGDEPIGNIVHPKGVCTDDCPEGAGKLGWFKVYSNGTTDWSWRSSTYDRDPHAIFAKFNSPGTYTVQISARSKHHFLNRFVMYDPNVYSESEATDLSLSESGFVGTRISNPLLGLMDVYPNPASTYIELNSKNNVFVRYEILNISGKVVLNGALANSLQRVNISSIIDGIYFLRCFDANGIGKSTRLLKRAK